MFHKRTRKTLVAPPGYAIGALTIDTEAGEPISHHVVTGSDPGAVAAMLAGRVFRDGVCTPEQGDITAEVLTKVLRRINPVDPGLPAFPNLAFTDETYADAVERLLAQDDSDARVRTIFTARAGQRSWTGFRAATEVCAAETSDDGPYECSQPVRYYGDREAGDGVARVLHASDIPGVFFAFDEDKNIFLRVTAPPHLAHLTWRRLVRLPRRKRNYLNTFFVPGSLDDELEWLTACPADLLPDNKHDGAAVSDDPEN